MKKVTRREKERGREEGLKSKREEESERRQLRVGNDARSRKNKKEVMRRKESKGKRGKRSLKRREGEEIKG